LQEKQRQKERDRLTRRERKTAAEAQATAADGLAAEADGGGSDAVEAAAPAMPVDSAIPADPGKTTAAGLPVSALVAASMTVSDGLTDKGTGEQQPALNQLSGELQTSGGFKAASIQLSASPTTHSTHSVTGHVVGVLSHENTRPEGPIHMPLDSSTTSEAATTLQGVKIQAKTGSSTAAEPMPSQHSLPNQLHRDSLPKSAVNTLPAVQGRESMSFALHNSQGPGLKEVPVQASVPEAIERTSPIAKTADSTGRVDVAHDRRPGEAATVDLEASTAGKNDLLFFIVLQSRCWQHKVCLVKPLAKASWHPGRYILHTETA
jgi:hypothetical protein